ncbi:AAA family ATPase [Methanogenium sp. MK-MG]|uniref:AAA family ATPase n=1 Tax=Methanogenium sp. MK-MG TaxID=2599926 RepID=UPI0013EB692F|nr:AAA family ATPase [Methanogenium sp. MK-MG]KAF1078363.1 Replication factor C small subunit [Methanogenium sp. MK-MG]
MLWIEKYRPETFEDIRGQDAVIAMVKAFSKDSMLPHLLISGRHGTGKSAAVECIAKTLYGEFWKENTTVIQTGALFRGGRTYLEHEEKFSHLYKKEASVITNFKYIVRWFASVKPLDAEFKLMVFDEAESLTFEAQQALRRMMERFSGTCRFIFITRTQSAIIPAITSRALPLFFRPLSDDTILELMTEILAKEEVPKTAYEKEEMELIAAASRGDARKAILFCQMNCDDRIEGGFEEYLESETGNIARSVFRILRNGDMEKAKSVIEILMLEYGLSGPEVLEELSRARKQEYNDPRVTVAIADADLMMRDAGNEYIQMDAFLSGIVKEIFSAE